MRILVDTGVLLRAFDRSSPEQRTIFRALRKLWSDNHDLVTTSQNVAEFWNVSTRPAQARGGLGLPVTAVDARVKASRNWASFLRFLTVRTTSGVGWSWRNRLSVWQSMTPDS
jgi:predicted nucleic acid-binding protein